MLSHLKRNKSMKLGLPRTTKNCDSRELPKRWECGGGSPLLTAVGGQLSNGAITRFRFLGTTQFVITNNQNLISPPDTTWSRKSELLLCGRNLESLSEWAKGKRDFLVTCIPHICHFLYTGRIFKFKMLHLEITQIYPKKVKYVVFLRSIWKNLHPTEFFTRAAPVVPVTNMRYAQAFSQFCSVLLVLDVLVF